MGCWSGIWLLFIVLLSPFSVQFVQAGDWESCASDLENLQSAADEASDAARKAESAKDELENCQMYPDTFDLMDDDCETARSEYEDAVSRLKSELDSVVSEFHSVDISCGLSRPTSLGGSHPSSPRTGCNLFLRFKEKLPKETLMQSCIKVMPESDCKSCLEVK